MGLIILPIQDDFLCPQEFYEQPSFQNIFGNRNNYSIITVTAEFKKGEKQLLTQYKNTSPTAKVTKVGVKCCAK